MASSYLLSLREGIEAALLTGIFLGNIIWFAVERPETIFSTKDFEYWVNIKSHFMG